MKNSYTLEELLAINKNLEAENNNLKASLEKETIRNTRYINRVKREKEARKEAEKILEKKSLELYKATEKLMLLNYNLESQVAERTEELKATIVSLEKANYDIHQFTYLASHDLKTPLRAIGSLLGFLEQDLSEIPEAAEVIEDSIALIKNRVHRMNHLLNSILEYSEIGRRAINKYPVDVLETVNEVLENLPTNHDYKIILQDSLLKLNTNRNRLFKVIMHIVDNAIKHHESTEKIQLEFFTTTDKDWYKLHIKDNGLGIPARYHERIFQIFQTLKTKDKNNGSIGVGLPIVKKIMEEEMDGKLLMKSIENQGTTFIFCFPAKDIIS